MNRPRLLAVRSLVTLAVLGAALGTAAIALALSSAPPDTTLKPPPYDADAECVACHSIAELKVELPGGETLGLYVDTQEIAQSVHGNKLLCTDCHRDLLSYPHPPRRFTNLREFSIDQYELCKRCHFSNYTKTLDSAHFNALSQGVPNAPLCTDCHGAHDVAHPGQPRSAISQTCSECHGAIYDTYVVSVHGAALVKENNQDVPVCTDCHQVHNIQNPTTAEFRVRSVQLCSSCHSDKQLMDKYGISTAVASTYLKSFHGMSVSLSGEKGEKREISEPVCTDCHGVHDIQVVTSPDSPVIKANLVATCQKCHEGADVNFPSSWVGHYEPSLSKAPAVFLIRWFYRLLIPFIIGGLAVHILLDLWKVTTNK